MGKKVGLSNRQKNLLAFIPLIIVLLIVFNDLTVQYYHTPPKADACSDYIIIDVYGLLKDTPISKNPCYVSGMSVSDFRALGKIKAREIIIVSHYFFSGKVKGLGTSDKVSPLIPFIHPISVFYMVKGKTPEGTEYIAVSPGMMTLSDKPKGKDIVIISCSAGIEKTAAALASSGANIVLVSNTPSLTKQKAASIVEKVLTEKDASMLCSSQLFTCYGG